MCLASLLPTNAMPPGRDSWRNGSCADAGDRPVDAFAGRSGVCQGLLQPVLTRVVPFGVGHVRRRGGLGQPHITGRRPAQVLQLPAGERGGHLDGGRAVAGLRACGPAGARYPPWSVHRGGLTTTCPAPAPAPAPDQTAQSAARQRPARQCRRGCPGTAGSHSATPPCAARPGPDPHVRPQAARMNQGTQSDQQQPRS